MSFYCWNSEDHKRDGREDFDRYGRYGYDREKYDDHYNDCSRYYREGFDDARRQDDYRREIREEEERQERRMIQEARDRREAAEADEYAMIEAAYYNESERQYWANVEKQMADDHWNEMAKQYEKDHPDNQLPPASPNRRGADKYNCMTARRDFLKHLGFITAQSSTTIKIEPVMTEEIVVHPVTKYLAEEWNFKKYYQTSGDKIDLNHYTCLLRIHEIHYLYWSELYKMFSIRVHHDRPKGKPATGELQCWTDVMIPKIIYTLDDARKLLEAIVDKKHLHLYL